MEDGMRVGWIGAGRMGVPMAGFLLRAGFPVTVWSPSASSREKLVALGATAAGGVQDCVARAQIVFSSVADDAALRSVAREVVAHARPGTYFVETSTVSPEVSAEVARAAEAKGIPYLRAPISGNAVSARKGEVTVMMSGPRDAFDAVRPAVAHFSKAQVYLGTGEEARTMKLVVNALVVNLAQSLAEALALGSKSGLDWNTMLDTIAESTVASPWLKAKTALLKERDFSTTMSVRLILKDIDLMLAAARTTGVPMPLTAATRQVMQVLAGEGHAEEDYMVLVKLAERQSGIADDRPGAPR